MANKLDAIKQTKEEIRQRMSRIRKNPPLNLKNASQKVCGNLESKILNMDFTCLAFFWPMEREVNLVPLMENLSEKGVSLALPVVDDEAKPLKFYSWQKGDELKKAKLGQSEPNTNNKEVAPDLVLVPLLAFDRDGYRIGYGGGYYDRTLAYLRDKQNIQAIGVSFSFQELKEVPRENSDQRLDWIVTEKEVMRVNLFS